MAKEKYQPTPEETKKAEGTMTKEQEKASKERERVVEKMVDLGDDGWIRVNTIKEAHAGSGHGSDRIKLLKKFKGEINGHSVVGEFSLTQKDYFGSHLGSIMPIHSEKGYKLQVDGKDVDEDVARAFYDKYAKLMVDKDVEAEAVDSIFKHEPVSGIEKLKELLGRIKKEN
jgi:hypothetical protein